MPPAPPGPALSSSGAAGHQIPKYSFSLNEASMHRLPYMLPLPCLGSLASQPTPSVGHWSPEGPILRKLLTEEGGCGWMQGHKVHPESLTRLLWDLDSQVT